LPETRERGHASVPKGSEESKVARNKKTTDLKGFALIKWLLAIAVIADIHAVVSPSISAKGVTREEMKEQRKQTAHRQRRLIHNSDGHDITPLAGTHVDSIFNKRGKRIRLNDMIWTA
jgi:hypothetical protein